MRTRYLALAGRAPRPRANRRRSERQHEVVPVALAGSRGNEQADAVHDLPELTVAQCVAASVWEALRGLLGRDARRLAALPPGAPKVPAMYRAASLDRDALLDAPPRAQQAEPELDEVDRLFGRGLR